MDDTLTREEVDDALVTVDLAPRPARSHIALGGAS